MVVVKGVRTVWSPEPVRVEVREATFLSQGPLAKFKPVLANAFYLENVPYSWQPGTLEAIR